MIMVGYRIRFWFSESLIRGKGNQSTYLVKSEITAFSGFSAHLAMPWELTWDKLAQHLPKKLIRAGGYFRNPYSHLYQCSSNISYISVFSHLWLQQEIGLMLVFMYLKPLLLLQDTVSIHDRLVSTSLPCASPARLHLGFRLPKKKFYVQHSSVETCNFDQDYCHQRRQLPTKW